MNFIKKAIAVAISVATMIASFSMASFADSYLPCDVNDDGRINMKDVLVIRKYIAGMNVEINLKAADCNNMGKSDGAVNMKDVLYMRKVIAGIYAEPERVNDYIDFPTNYPTTVESSKVFVNQIGYSKNADKAARVVAQENRQTYLCGVVDAVTGKVVYAADTSAAGPDSNSGKQIAKFDFSSVTTPGTYYISTPVGRSYDFTIAAQPYNKVQDAMVTALYYNRCGTALDEKIVGSAYKHDVCHSSASVPVYFMNVLDSASGKYKVNSVTSTSDKFSGGLHDAGDYGRYTMPAYQVVADLLYTSEIFPDGSTTNVITDNEGENINDLLDEARYEMKWLLKMQNKATGGVYFRLATKAFAGWYVQPDKDDQFKSSLGLYMSREMVKPTAGFAGAAASSYVAFKDIDPTFASECLAAAKSAYAYVEKHENDADAKASFANSTEINGSNAGEYGSTEIYGDIFYAASSLFRATNESKYHDKAKKVFDEKINVSNGVSITQLNAYNIGGAGALAYLLNDKADASYKSKMLSLIKKSCQSCANVSKKDKFGNVIAAGSYYWGSNGLIGNVTQFMAFYDYFSKTNTFEPYVRNAVDFMFGENWSGYSFVTGYGSQTPKYPHHRPSMQAGHASNADPVPGWLVGGITGASYEDSQQNYSTNEVCIYWNTPAIATVAYLIAVDKAAK